MYLFTDGFRLQKIFAGPLGKEDVFLYEKKDLPKNVKEILDQKFTYLSKGRQVYVFESDDQKYVIKFFRNNKYIYPLWADVFSFFNILNGYQKQTLKERVIRCNRAYTSYILADKNLKEETGFIFLSIKDISLMGKKVVVIDKGKRKFNIPLHRVSFIIQKKAKLFDKLLNDSCKNKNITEIESLVRSFYDICAKRSSKGIFNRDFANAMRNVGVVENKVVELDLGSFYRDDKFTMYEEKQRYKHVLYQFCKQEFNLDELSILEPIIEKQSNL
jgi:hypothetical protein